MDETMIIAGDAKIMNTMVLAEMTSNWDISGVFCLASILFLLIAAMAYSTGPWSGSCTCLIFFFIALFATGENRSVTGVSPNKMFIANESQTKIIEKNKYSINGTDCIFWIWDNGTSTLTDDITYFIPAEEMYTNEDGWHIMKSTGQKPTDDDYYIWNETYSPANVAVEAGGWGVPQWVYHPASPTYIFGLAGLPALLGGMFIASKVL